MQQVWLNSALWFNSVTDGRTDAFTISPSLKLGENNNNNNNNEDDNYNYNNDTFHEVRVPIEFQGVSSVAKFLGGFGFFFFLFFFCMPVIPTDLSSLLLSVLGKALLQDFDIYWITSFIYLIIGRRASRAGLLI